MRVLVDAYITALQEHLPEMGERWQLVRYQKPLLRQTHKPGVAVYPLDEDAEPATDGYDFNMPVLAVEYWENANREAETLKRDEAAAGRWLDLFERFKKAIYSIPELQDEAGAWDARYIGSDFDVDDEAAARVFRLGVRLRTTSPGFP